MVTERRIHHSFRDFEPERRLGVAVIEQALLDATRPIRGRQTQLRKQRALTWLLEPSPDREFWCQVAGIDGTALARRLEAVNGQKQPASP